MLSTVSDNALQLILGFLQHPGCSDVGYIRRQFESVGQRLEILFLVGGRFVHDVPHNVNQPQDADTKRLQSHIFDDERIVKIDVCEKRLIVDKM